MDIAGVFGQNAIQADSSLSFETQLRCFKEDEGTTDSSLTFKVLDNKFLRSTGFVVREDSGPRRLGQSVSMMPDPSSQEHISRLWTRFSRVTRLLGHLHIQSDQIQRILEPQLLLDVLLMWTGRAGRCGGGITIGFRRQRYWINVFLLWSVIFSLLRRR